MTEHRYAVRVVRTVTQTVETKQYADIGVTVASDGDRPPDTDYASMNSASAQAIAAALWHPGPWLPMKSPLPPADPTYRFEVAERTAPARTKRCEDGTVGADGECRVCGAEQGIACRKPEVSR